MSAISYCSFCGKTQHEVRVMLAGPVSVRICSDCVMAACDQVVDAARNRTPQGREIVFADFTVVEGVSEPLAAILGRATRAMTLAKERYPAPNYTLLKVAEEAGEVVKAAVHYGERRGQWSDVEAEAVQAIAMILRLLDEGDAVNGIAPPTPSQGEAR